MCNARSLNVNKQLNEEMLYLTYIMNLQIEKWTQKTTDIKTGQTLQ